MELVLKDYQKKGIDFAIRNKKALIADEMGLGKTIQAIGLANWMYDNEIEKKKDSIVVVCPAILKYNWKSEFEKWFKFGLGISVIEKDNKNTNADLIIVNYERLEKIEFEHSISLLIVDESHYIKSKKSKRYKIVKKLAQEAHRVLFLSGTPMPNRTEELWTTCDILAPRKYGSWFSFVTKYCAAYEGTFGWVINGSSFEKELNQRIRRDFMIRRLKKDVLQELEPKVRQIIPIESNKKVSEIMKREIGAILENSEYSDISEIPLELIVELARKPGQASKIAEIRQEISKQKIPKIIELLKTFEESGIKKVVIFAHYKDTIKKLCSELECLGITGEDSALDRQTKINLFQNDDKHKYIVCSIRASGVGITLTSASTVVFAEIDWTPSVMSQCEDRCHRIGQTGVVNVFIPLYNNSLDYYIMGKIIEKQKIIDLVMEEEK